MYLKNCQVLVVGIKLPTVKTLDKKIINDDFKRANKEIRVECENMNFKLIVICLSALDIRQLYINEKSKQANYFTQFDKYPQNRVIHSNTPKKPSMLSKISVYYLLNRILTYGNRISKK
ncbi:uncharacterized protein EV154DRAFT_488697 [Mucor mucedo]|uniref:uncharacterized protein n=1 Tax=Mucor mucedo TaxID=29922 RepID=UPI00221E6C62|nr:uncharacterized protein EV154DRAFT_488697 [Mucor mucedo]KAI7865549.1 hypothetical protein EV154DRAFT_488697 [Mucor mucedo]